jgi:hypothetical protein
MTCGLTVDHNVVWDCGSVGITIKNVNKPTPEEANACVNNTVFNHSAFNKIKSAIIIPTVPGKSNVPDPSSLASRPNAAETPNAWSIVANNLADSIYGMWNARPLGKVKLDAANDAAFQAATDLVNKDWNDFRPAANATAIIHQGVAVEGITGKVSGNAPDIGAYERGDRVYWIPGRRETKATFPIVPDGAQDVPVDRDVLMWRPAYLAVGHQVQFGTSKEILKKTCRGEANVFTLPALSNGKTYYWRVDAVMPDGSVVKGDVWRFKVKERERPKR